MAQETGSGGSRMVTYGALAVAALAAIFAYQAGSTSGEMQKRAEQATSQLTSLAGERDTLKAEIDKLTGAAKSAADESAGLKGKLDGAMKDVEGLKSQLQSALGERDTLKAERDKLQGELDEAANRLDEAMGQVTSSGTEIENITKERDSLKAESKNLMTDRDCLKSLVDGLKKELEAARAEVQKLKSAAASGTSG